MTQKPLCIHYKKAVGDYQIHITVKHTGGRSFSVLKTEGGVLNGVASGKIHWGAKVPVLYDHGAQVPPDLCEHILRASYDMYLTHSAASATKDISP